MSLSESVLYSYPILSPNDFHTDDRRPLLAHRNMTFPSIKKRLFARRPYNLKKRKLSQESSEDSSDEQQDVTTTQLPTIRASKVQCTSSVAPHDASSDDKPRKRSLFPQWIEQQAQRFRWQRDSIIGYHYVKRASKDTNTVVIGPDGEPVPEDAIHEFFKLHQTGGSDWRNSAQWEDHLAKYLAKKAVENPPIRSPSPSPSRSPGRFHISRVSWGSKPSEPKGKEIAVPSDEPPKAPIQAVRSVAQDEPPNPEMQTPQTSSDGMSPRRRDIHMMWDYQLQKSAYTSQIPSPPTPDLKPRSSKDFDPTELAQITGRPSEPSPIETIEFPLSGPLLSPPSTPQLKPEQRNASVPEMKQLSDSYSPSDDSMSLRSPCTPSTATNIHHWPTPSTLHDATTPDSEVTEEHDRKLSISFQAATISDVLWHGKNSPQTSDTRSSSTVTAIRHASPPTLADTRRDSHVHSCTYRNKNKSARRPSPPVAHDNTETAPSLAEPEGSADRDRNTCVLSDTTGSPLPDCPVFVSKAEHRRKLEQWWAGMTERHGRLRKVDGHWSLFTYN